LVDIKNIKKEFVRIFSPNLIMLSEKERLQLCVQPYHKHPKGCPNFGKRDYCPPKARPFLETHEKRNAILMIAIFDFKEYIIQRIIEHPEWTNRQLLNQRYWQGHVKAYLTHKVLGQRFYEWDEYLDNPEAKGINVQETLKQYKHKMTWAKSDEKGNIISFPEKMYQVGIKAKRKINDTTKTPKN